MKACPYCGESIQDVAVKCRYCGEWLDPSKRPAWSESAPTEAPTSAPHLGHPQAPTQPITTQHIAQPAPQAVAPAPQHPQARQPLSQPLAYQPLAQPLAYHALTQPLAYQAQPEPEATPQAAAPQPLGDLVSHSLASPSAPLPGPPPYDERQESALRVVPNAEPTQPPSPRPATSIGDLPWGRTSAHGGPMPTWRPPASAPAESVPSDRSQSAALPAPPPPPERRPLGFGDRPPPSPASLQALLTAPAPLSEPPGTATPAPARAAWEASGSLPSPSESIELQLEDVEASAPRRPVPSPAAPTPAPSREASAASNFEASFFGGGDAFFDDPASDSMADGDPFASTVAPAARPIPWGPILAGGALLLLVLAIGLRGGDEAAAGDTDGASATEGAGDKSDDKADKPDKPDKDEKTDAPAKASDGGEAADKAAASPEAEATPPPPQAPPPAADDPELTAKLAEARAAYEKHRLKPAEAALDEVAASHPSHPEVLLLRAQIQLERGDLAGSLATSTRCVEVAPTQADCWLTLGVLHQNNKATDAAIKAYETYLGLAPEGRYARDATSQLARLKK